MNGTDRIEEGGSRVRTLMSGARVHYGQLYVVSGDVTADLAGFGGQVNGLCGGAALSLASLDRPLVDALAETDPTAQRQVARWAIRRAFTEAGLADVDWIAPALAAMDQGEAMPPPFEDTLQPWDRMTADERIPQTVVTTLDGRYDNFSRQAMALPAIFAELEPDPMVAAFDAVWSAIATYGRGQHGVLFGELRNAFPAIA